MTTRLCCQCGQSKTIQGVWYLLTGASQPGAFACETCFRARRATPLPRPLPPFLEDGFARALATLRIEEEAGQLPVRPHDPL